MPGSIMDLTKRIALMWRCGVTVDIIFLRCRGKTGFLCPALTCEQLKPSPGPKPAA